MVILHTFIVMNSRNNNSVCIPIMHCHKLGMCTKNFNLRCDYIIYTTIFFCRKNCLYGGFISMSNVMLYLLEQNSIKYIQQNRQITIIIIWFKKYLFCLLWVLKTKQKMENCFTCTAMLAVVKIVWTLHPKQNIAFSVHIV